MKPSWKGVGVAVPATQRPRRSGAGLPRGHLGRAVAGRIEAVDIEAGHQSSRASASVGCRSAGSGQRGHRLARQGRAAAGRLGDALPAVLGEAGNVRPALPERRGGEPDDVEAVEQVLAEASRRASGSRRPGARGAAWPARGGVSSATSSSRTVPPDDSSSGPFPLLRRAGERAPRMPEQFGLEQLVAEHGAVDRHEDRPAARPLLVERGRSGSLPVPVSPSTTTGKGDVATRGISAFSSRIGPLSPTSRATPRGPSAPLRASRHIIRPRR